MTVEVEIWVRKPFFVSAVQVTEENMETIAAWCNGKITAYKGEEDNRYIKVFVKNPMTPRQTKAFVGDWVLKSRDSFKVYKHESFLKVFDKTELVEVPEETTPKQEVEDDESIDLTRLIES
jgi:hypothetical protein